MTASNNSKRVVTTATKRGFRIFDHTRQLYVHKVTVSGVQWTNDPALARMYRRHRSATLTARKCAVDYRLDYAECSYRRNIVAMPANPVLTERHARGITVEHF